ncbi:Glycoprotein-N-acetylgalactosamine 3-beta-galactosyltransferase 1-B [Chelonia mydas]|uniref:N-acetylgalactosaminide beta-1,3-galactosyltransferase n=1 Tax=Chelonia mydas TaxID=8469 RepID=M7CD72_CHEMY|nr:Glycoprotein-N-acetylgalactosamine 3-beta-galactosyltransferase 1-B [Chelonia mydas]
MTGPSNLETKARHVQATWARHCNVVLFMSSVRDDGFPAVGLDTKEGRDQLYWKTIRAFQYVHQHHLEQADWFLKADDDTFVVLDNLRWLLANHTPEAPVYFGKRFKPFAKQGYMSGGAGYVLSKEALRRFVEGFRTQVCSHTSSVEDLALGQCMEKMGVRAGDSRDAAGRETFHPFGPESHLTGKFSKSFWYWNYCYYPIVEVCGRLHASLPWYPLGVGALAAFPSSPLGLGSWAAFIPSWHPSGVGAQAELSTGPAVLASPWPGEVVPWSRPGCQVPSPQASKTPQQHVDPA